MGVTKVENAIERLELDEPERPNRLGVRHIQACLLFTALVVGYFLRVNMSVAVVAMTSGDSDADVETYQWDSTTRSILLSSFFWGYVVAQLPSGVLAQLFGAKIVLAISTGFCAIFTVIIPFASSFGGWIFVCVLRVLIGLTQGVVYPCVHTLLANWAPKTERGLMASFVYSGAQLGTVIMLATSGWMSNSTLGWPSIFYISGGLSFIWALMYFAFGADSPATVQNISKEERNYIESLTGSSNHRNLQIPWQSFFTSVPFVALIFAHCGYTWGFYTLLTEIPTYLAKALDMDINQNGLISALPYLVMWIISLIIGPISDLLINKGVLSVEGGRKLFNSIGQWIPMVCLIGLGYMTRENTVWAILLLTIAVGFNSACYLGYMVNHIDLAPNYAGTMMGITNGISNLLSVFAPIVVGGIVVNEHDPTEWRIVFFLTAGVYLICNLVFILFGKANIQSWNDKKSTSEHKGNSNNNNLKF